jgi:demethylmenaquinone methyltransferase/2-methoxy-6-polyprenyl-1,4-benzoquinol methylase
VLELACGTGLWSERLLPGATRLTLVDAAPEALALCRERLARIEHRSVVDFQLADLFEWRPSRRYDVVFFGFWLSHVPPARFAGFWQLVGECLAPGGRVFLVDSLPAPGSGARDHVPPADGVALRRLDDGREFRVVKVFHTADSLAERLRPLGFRAQLASSGRFFLHGEASPA